MLPSFLVAGIMKSGTTYLDNLIRRHPQLLMLERSMELSFFDNDTIWKKGIKWYEEAFSAFEGKVGIIGQTSADCAFNPESIERIKEAIPDAKLIFVIRNPIDRLYSLFWHQVAMGREPLTFEEAIDKESTRIAKSYYDFKMYSYVARSQYATQFRHILDVFDRSQVLIIPFELLVKKELEMLNVVFDFLKVEQIEDIRVLKSENTKRNKARIPQNRLAIKASYYLQQAGMVGAGRNLLNRFRVEQKPPAMKPETRSQLEIILEEDLIFHQAIIDKYVATLSTQKQN